MRTLVVGMLLASSIALAHGRRFHVVPSVYDPGHTNGVISRWSPFGQDGDPAIIMAKILATSAEAAAVARVDGVKNITLTELGYDVFDGGHCGAGAPRFNVTTTAGYLYFFGCFYGEHAPAPDQPGTFTRVRFRNEDAYPQYTTNPIFPGFGKARIADISIIFDEGTDQGSGFTAVADIDINGEIVEGPRGDHDDHDDHD